MRRSPLAALALVALTATACSGDDGSSGDDSASGPTIEFSADSVEAFVEEAAGDRLTCLDHTDAPAFTTCLTDNTFSPQLYVFRDDQGEPQQVYLDDDSGLTLSELINALRATLFADLSEDEVEDALAADDVTEFNGAAVRKDDGYVVIAADADAAEKGFPVLPTLDGDAALASLQQSFQAQCVESDGRHNCNGAGAEFSVGTVDGERTPVTLSAQVDVTTEDNYFENVPEFLDAAGVPLSEESLKALAACDPEMESCRPTLLTENGLVVELMANFQFTQVDVKELPSFD